MYLGNLSFLSFGEYFSCSIAVTKAGVRGELFPSLASYCVDREKKSVGKIMEGPLRVRLRPLMCIQGKLKISSNVFNHCAFIRPQMSQFDTFYHSLSPDPDEGESVSDIGKGQGPNINDGRGCMRLSIDLS